MLEVSEIYHAPQGEGRYIGRQMLFVRMNKCPLSCTWCDTAFTWDKNHPDYGKGVKKYTVAELAQEMIDRFFESKFVDYGPMSVSFTGGEPMMYQRELPEVIDLFRDTHKIPIEVETAGVIVPNDAMLSRCHFNVSPKLSSAGNEHIKPTLLWNSEATKRYAVMGVHTFKLVVGEGDERSLRDYLDWLHMTTKGLVPWHTMRERIYLMPEGVTAIDIAKRQRYIIDLSSEHGVCATTRMHITAYSDKRGT